MFSVVVENKEECESGFYCLFQLVRLVLVHGCAGSRLTLCFNYLAEAEGPFPCQNLDRSVSFVGYTENPSHSFSGDKASGEAAIQQDLLLGRWIPSTKTVEKHGGNGTPAVFLINRKNHWLLCSDLAHDHVTWSNWCPVQLYQPNHKQF